MAVQFNAVSTTKGTLGQYTLQHTASGEKRAVVVSVSIYDIYAQSRTVTGITYAGIALTKLAELSSSGVKRRIELWGLVNPPTGQQTVVVTLSGSSAQAVIGVTSYIGVNQSTPWRNTGTNTDNSNAGTVSVDNTLADDMVLGAISVAVSTGLTTPATMRWQDTQEIGDGLYLNGSGSTKTGTGTVIFTWNHATEVYSAAAVTIAGAEDKFGSFTISGNGTTSFTGEKPISGYTTSITSASSTYSNGYGILLQGEVQGIESTGDTRNGSFEFSGNGNFSITATKNEEIVGSEFVISGNGSAVMSGDKDVNASFEISGNENIESYYIANIVSAEYATGEGIYIQAEATGYNFLGSSVDVGKSFEISGNGDASFVGQKDAYNTFVVSGNGSVAFTGSPPAVYGILVGGELQETPEYSLESETVTYQASAGEFNVAGNGVVEFVGQRSKVFVISGKGSAEFVGSKGAENTFEITGGGDASAEGVTEYATFGQFVVSGNGEILFEGDKAGFNVFVVTENGTFEIDATSEKFGEFVVSGNGSVIMVSSEMPDSIDLYYLKELPLDFSLVEKPLDFSLKEVRWIKN